MTDSQDHLRRGWAQRLWSTGKIAREAARLASKQLAGAGDAGGAIGERLAAELDQMKGVAMKIGQILSYFDGALPEETHAALRRLQAGAEPMSYARVSDVVRAALGARPEELFDVFVREPVAAASIGQVHRARRAGRELAVKVQYPGVRETMVADVSRLRSLSRIASLATAVDGVAMVEELAQRFELECDYELEARNQNAFRAAFDKYAEIKIPEAILSLSRSTVLTSEWCEGTGFYELIERADATKRSAVGLILARFAFISLWSAGVVNADPHPGNYLFRDDGAVVFLDFGCVRRFDPELITRERRVLRAVLSGDRREFRDAVLASGVVPKEKGFDFELHRQMLEHQYQPYLVPQFRFTMDYVRRGMDFSRPNNPNLRRLAIPPQSIWVLRLIWGLHAVLARLDAEGPFADELHAALDARLEVAER